MLHLLMGNEPWFRQKRYGLGAGLPIRWQGWALIVSYLCFVAGMTLWADPKTSNPPALWWSLFGGVTALFLVLCWRRTEGGWQWRWGT
jgi:hypothetical protein